MTEEQIKALQDELATVKALVEEKDTKLSEIENTAKQTSQQAKLNEFKYRSVKSGMSEEQIDVLSKLIDVDKISEDIDLSSLIQTKEVKVEVPTPVEEPAKEEPKTPEEPKVGFTPEPDPIHKEVSEEELVRKYLGL